MAKKKELKSIPSILFNQGPPALCQRIKVNTFFNFIFFFHPFSQEWESKGVYLPSSCKMRQFLTKFHQNPRILCLRFVFHFFFFRAEMWVKMGPMR